MKSYKIPTLAAPTSVTLWLDEEDCVDREQEVAAALFLFPQALRSILRQKEQSIRLQFLSK